MKPEPVSGNEMFTLSRLAQLRPKPWNNLNNYFSFLETTNFDIMQIVVISLSLSLSE